MDASPSAIDRSARGEGLDRLLDAREAACALNLEIGRGPIKALCVRFQQAATS